MTGTRVLIVGDGPAGLSAALLLAKTGFEVDVIGANETPARKAHLRNFLGEDDTPGPHFVETAREHAQRYGARLHEARVERVEAGATFRAVTDGGEFEGDYLVVATGFGDAIAGLDLEEEGEGYRVDHNGRTSRERVYAGGAAVRGTKSQVATSVGDGSAIAVDILSRERGEPSHDWDVMKAKAQARQREA